MTMRNVVITGGAKGLGRAFAEAIGRTGANVVITGRDRQALDRARDELRSAECSVWARAADVTAVDAMAEVIRNAQDRFGDLDVLVNNAGVLGPVGPTWEVAQEEWWHAMEVNTRGTFLACCAALEAMVPHGKGKIINIVSHAGAHRWPYVTAYSVSKAAVIKLTENLAVEARRHGVTVMSYHPGFVDIGLTRTGIPEPAAADNRWAARLVAWAQAEQAAGRITPVHLATSVLLRLIESTDPDLSGRYITVDDESVTFPQ